MIFDWIEQFGISNSGANVSRPQKWIDDIFQQMQACCSIKTAFFLQFSLIFTIGKIQIGPQKKNPKQKIFILGLFWSLGIV